MHEVKRGHQKCCGADCSHGAKFVPRICVPAMGWAIDMHTPLTSLVGMPLCESCFGELNVADFIGRFDQDDGQNSMRELFTALTVGKQPPDFERAWLEKVRISSAEAQRFFVEAGAAKEQRTLH